MNYAGRKEPIPTPAQTPLLGLGKATQDAYMLSNAISKPKELESIIIARESEEAKVKREEKVKEIQTRVVEREDRLKTFHCHVCDKGFVVIPLFLFLSFLMLTIAFYFLGDGISKLHDDQSI